MKRISFKVLAVVLTGILIISISGCSSTIPSTQTSGEEVTVPVEDTTDNSYQPQDNEVAGSFEELDEW